MYYLCAQPDALYFKWQLEVMLFNFRKNAIPAEKIHILIGYNPENGINPKFIELANEQNENACFFFYIDDRITSHYAPSIRPNIIKKHFLVCPYLKDECIFYHDADIIFRELPDFKRLCEGNTWYASDTKSYLNADYIKNKGIPIFYEMCELMNIDRDLILSNNDNTGGAQWVLKNVNYQFWDKIEQDSERLFKYLTNNNERYADIFCKTVGIGRSAYQPFQSWCTDMWVIFWNALSLGYNVKIDNELDFCWPHNPIERWEETKILHNAGAASSASGEYFCKGDFHNSDPYDMDFSTILTDKCTIKYVEAIQECRNSRKTDLSDVTFILTLDVHSQDQVNNIYTTLNFINRHIKTNVLLAEVGMEPVLKEEALPACVQNFFFNDANGFHKARYNNLMIGKATTPIVSLYDVDVIFDPLQMETAVNKIRSGECVISYPYQGTITSAWDAVLRPFFESKLDARMFLTAISIENSKSYGGAVFLNRETYIQCGMDNEFIAAGETEDMERPKRMEILGFRYQRVEGPVYHLSYQRELNYKPDFGETYDPSLDEYLRICKMSKEELTNEIAKWKWSNAHRQQAC